MSAISLRAIALYPSSLVDTSYPTTAGIVGIVAANVNITTTAFGRSEGFVPPALGTGKDETFGEQRFAGNGGGGGSDGGDGGDGGDDVDAVEYVKQQRIRLFDILGDIDNRKNKVKLSRKEMDELTVQGLEVCYDLTERARVEKAVLDELIATYPKRVSETAINNPAILVVYGEFSVKESQLSVYANILQKAHDGIDGTGRSMTTAELGAALRKSLRGFYKKYCLQSDVTAKSKTAPNEPFTLGRPFRTTVFGTGRSICRVEVAVDNCIATARMLDTPVVEPTWTDYDETTGQGKNSPPVSPPPTTVLTTMQYHALDHEILVRDALLHIVEAGTAQNYNAMAKALNATGITTARKNKWYANTLKKALESWDYGSIEEFVAAYTDDPDDANDPNGEDDPPPATSAPVPTVPTTTTEAKGTDVKAPPATVPLAGNVDAAEIANDAGDDGSAAGDDHPDPPPASPAPTPLAPNGGGNDGRPAGYTNLALGPAPNMVVLESPATKDAMIAVLQVVSGIGLDTVGIEAADGEWKVWANDGIDKTVFMSGGCKITELIDVKFIISEIPGLLNALNASSEKIGLEFDDIRVFKKIDPSDDNSETIEVVKRRLTKIKIGRYIHAVDASGAPKAILKIDPKWTISTSIDLKCGGMSEFKKLISGVRNTHDRFTATNDGGCLAFNINYDYKHSASIPICPGEFSSGLSEHGWGVVQFKKLLKGIAALKVQTINLSIDAATGLLMIDLNKQLGQNEAAFFQVIIPGKIGT